MHKDIYMKYVILHRHVLFCIFCYIYLCICVYRSIQHPCPSGQNMTVFCNGSANVYVRSYCPVASYQPSCSHLPQGGQSNDPSRCRVTSYSKTHTTCACDVCDVNVVPVDTKDGYGYNIVESNASIRSFIGLFDIVSVNKYVITQSPSILTPVPTSNVGSKKFPVVPIPIVSSFIVLWFGVLFLAGKR